VSFPKGRIESREVGGKCEGKCVCHTPKCDVIGLGEA
jgi:hypothetical protein